MRSRNEESLQSLSMLRRVPTDDVQAQTEWKGIICEVSLEQTLLSIHHPKSKGWKLELHQWIDLFWPKYFKRTCIVLAVSFFQQASGISALVYYAPTFFRALGQDSEMSMILAGMVHIIQLVGVITIILFLDRIGRRKLAIVGGVAMAIPHLIMAGIMSKYDGRWEANRGIGWFGVALIYIYVLCFAMSYGPLAWVLPAEVFPSSKRAKGVGAATAMNWLANFIIGVVVPEMLIQLGWGTYFFFGCFCTAAAVFAFFMIPETTGKSLEQITTMFEGYADAEEESLRRLIQHEVYISPTH